MKQPLLAWFLICTLLIAAAPHQQSFDPSPPATTVKLIFIHHSTGENWLTDGYGNLGQALNENNYFVSDTNYGWGPNSIGDRTDIPNWTEWFRSSDTPTYMQALFNETEQHANYTRTLPDPGGENEIILFKSCFPNSALSGSPNDPPGSNEELSVSGAKYVYNQILPYFASRPDKLFIVITAPPLSDPTDSANARAFNDWLVNNWLSENNYQLNNVAVFDFYNILTDPNAHHRFQDGRIEHLRGSRNTLYYPSGDDHPSEAGSRKATEEFVPLLNVLYHRWKESTPLQPTLPAPPTAAQPAPLPTSAPPGSPLLDDFEQFPQPGTGGWQTFWDQATATRLSCAPSTHQARQGAQALQLDFDLPPNTWATCATWYDTPQDWSHAAGLTLALSAAQPGERLDVEIYAGSPNETQETYLAAVTVAEEWTTIFLPWSDFQRVAWEENAGAPFAKPNQVLGLAFGLNSDGASAHRSGQIWVDELALASPTAPPTQAAAQATQPPINPPPLNTPSSPQSGLPCASALLPLSALLALACWRIGR